IMSAMEALAEAFALAEKNGVAPAALANMLGQTLFNCTVYHTYGRFIAERNYDPPRFRLDLGLKDASLVLDAARAARTPMPFAALIQQRILSGLAKGRGGLDWSAMALGAR